jgi:hypothetical protein
MKNIFDYIAFRVFEYFIQKDEALAISRTINFLVLFQCSLIVPLFIIVHMFTQIDPQIFGVDNRIKYYIGIPLALILIALNTFFYKNKLTGESLKNLLNKYHKEKYSLSIWIIFLSPVVFVFFCPIIYGAINGTLHFPFLER